MQKKSNPFYATNSRGFTEAQTKVAHLELLILLISLARKHQGLYIYKPKRQRNIMETRLLKVL